MTQLRCYSPDVDENAPGGLLQALEARQDEVLAQLDALNAQVEAVLSKLGIKLDEPYEPSEARDQSMLASAED